jgi:hypothetical protein
MNGEIRTGAIHKRLLAKSLKERNVRHRGANGRILLNLIENSARVFDLDSGSPRYEKGRECEIGNGNQNSTTTDISYTLSEYQLLKKEYASWI